MEKKAIEKYFLNRYIELSHEYKEITDKMAELERQITSFSQIKKNMDTEIFQLKTTLTYLGVKNV